jgi:Tol biopolymer transport system component
MHAGAGTSAARRALVAAAAVAAMGVAAQSASAAYPGMNGRIAFESTVTGNSEIFAVNADGTGVTNLTQDAAADTDPVFSPDGSRIAFVKTGEGHTNIWVMNADGTSARNLTVGPATTGPPAACPTVLGTGVAPTWSPDGSRIAYASGGEIMVMNADATGSGKRSLTCTAASVAAESAPAWAANGQIAYVRNSPSDIWAMNADGSGQHPVTATSSVGELAPDWSPDSRRIVYTRSGQVWTMNADGSGQAAIVSGPGKAGTQPAFAPDGTRIVFDSSAFTAPNGPDIFAMNPDGTAVTRIFGYVPGAELDPTWQPVLTGPPSGPPGPK